MKKIALSVFVAVLAVAAIGCSSSSKSSSSGSSTFNAADVTFAQSMVPHHKQAVEMADMAIAKSKNAQILDLARRIKAAQDPEITKMEAWLKQWGQSSKTHTSMGSGMHADSSSSTESAAMGDGMMSTKEMSQLGAATGARFDKLFLTLMVTHHEGAVKMAQTELGNGKSKDAKALATAIIKAQQAEIAEMKKLETSAG